jgi:signal recognition particle subunit SRP14
VSTTPPSKPQRPKDAFTDLHLSEPLPILVRATNGKSKAGRVDKIKLSTVVEPDALEAFFGRYAEVCKAGMGALKKRDRSGRKKAKAKKRKAGGEGEKKG